MSKSPKIFNTYYSRIELKQFDLKIFNNIRGISTERYVRRLVIIFCAKLFSLFSNTYFGTNVPKKVRQKKFDLCQSDFIFTNIFNYIKRLDIHKDFK